MKPLAKAESDAFSNDELDLENDKEIDIFISESLNERIGINREAVSYTHLTLPTICSV